MSKYYVYIINFIDSLREVNKLTSFSYLSDDSLIVNFPTPLNRKSLTVVRLKQTFYLKSSYHISLL